MVFPILFVGPAGSGKLTAARKELTATVHTPQHQTLEIGEYSAHYLEFSTHYEVDVSDLSMMDKQILPEILNQLLSSRDVRGGCRKIMILRRIHCLSPAAATRLRICLDELVWAPESPAMIWCTARTVNSAVASILDGFVYRRIPGPIVSRLKSSIADNLGVDVTEIRTVNHFIQEMLQAMNSALLEGPPTLSSVKWIRDRVYDLLGLMTYGADLVSGLVWATVRLAADGTLTTQKAKSVLNVLSRVRWVPSYRTPIIMEQIIVSVYNALGQGQ